MGKKVDPEESIDKSPETSVKTSDLYLPSVFLFSGKLYFVGGEKKNSKGKLKKNSRIYSINISEDIFILNEENIKLPIKVNNVFGISRGSDVLIFGGKLLENNEFNKNCLSMSIIKDKALFKEEPELPIE